MQSDWRHLGDVPVCAGARGAVACGGRIFAAGADGLLWRVDPADLSSEPVGMGGWRARLLASARGRVYAFDESGPLYAVEPAWGKHERLDGDWLDVAVAAGSEEQLFAAGRTLYAVEPDGTWRQMGDAVWTPKLLFAGPRDLYCLEENGGLFHLDLYDANPTQLDGDWSDVTSGVVIGDVLYLTSQAGWMYAVDASGECIPLEHGAPLGARFLLASGTSLRAIDERGAVHELALA